MNFRTTFILLILLLGVGAYLMFTGGKSATDTLQNTNPTRLLDINSNDVSKLIITPSEGDPIVLERHTSAATPPTLGPAQSDWRLVKPIDAYADASKVSDLLDAITGATSTAQVAIGGNASDFGLDTPQFTVDLEAGPKSARLDIGREEKAGNELYVHVEGKDVAEVVSGDLLDKLDTAADKLRLNKLVNADINTVNWISIQRPLDPLVLEKVAGQWQLTLPTTRPSAAPTTEPAEESVVSDLINAVSNAQATGFVAAGDSDALLIGQPSATIILSDKPPSTQPSQQSETIEFGSPDSLLGKNVWVRVTPPGALAKIAKETQDSILKSQLDLRDREVVHIDPSTVTQLRIVKNIPPTTQPIALPARTREVVLVRRPPQKPNLAIGPPAPTTQATTQPSSQPSLAAATQPASVWQISSAGAPADADDSKVDAALAVFNSLRADKFVAETPAAVKGWTTYYVTITTDKGEENLLLSDPGESSTDSPVGIYEDAIFDLPRTAITPVDADFTKATTKP